MGMAASQARFLGLTARKNNVEYEGQQINQQRTALSNQSASHYTDLLGMAVPVCPSVEDYTQTVYSFDDGALTNTITSLIAQGDGSYNVSYLSSYTDDFSVVSAGCTSVVNTGGGGGFFLVGASKLRTFAQDLSYSYILKEGSSTYRLYENGSNYNYTNAAGEARTLVPATYAIITSIIGAEPQREDFNVGALVEDYTTTQCYSSVLSSGNDKTRMYHIEHNLCRLMWADGSTSITSSSGVTLTRNSAASTSGYSLTSSMGNNNVLDQTSIDLQAALKNYWPDIYQQLVDTYIDAILHNDKAGYMMSTSLYTLSSDTANGVSEAADAVDASEVYDTWTNLWDTIKDLDYEDIYNQEHAVWQAQYDQYADKYFDSADYTKYYSITERQMYYDGEDEYLKSLSADQLEKLYGEEVTYRDMLEDMYGESEAGWYVRYVLNTSTGEHEPIFYNGDDIVNGVADEYGNVRSYVNTYKIGSKAVQNEVKGKEAMIEQDSTGRLINITFVDDSGTKRTYALTTSTVKDDAAYDDAMNQYEYDKALYDQSIEEINAKIEIIQAEDKNLELRLKQLDTEQDAISNELDAVEKVIEKSVESGFKTFG